MMFNKTQPSIDMFAQQLQKGYRNIYGTWKKEFGDVVVWAATMAAQIHSNLGDAAYHNVGHTIDVTLVGQEILRGQHITKRILPEEWMHILIACAFHDIGFIKLLLPEDEMGNYPRGSTGAFLNNRHVDRGKEFVLCRFADHEFINAQVVADYIEYTRFPVPDKEEYQETTSLRALVRAADFIGQLANLHLYQNQWALYQEFVETGANQQLGYETADDLRDGYPAFFFKVIKPYLTESIRLLQRTEEGRQIVNNLLANVFRAQYPEFSI